MKTEFGIIIGVTVIIVVIVGFGINFWYSQQIVFTNIEKMQIDPVVMAFKETYPVHGIAFNFSPMETPSATFSAGNAASVVELEVIGHHPNYAIQYSCGIIKNNVVTNNLVIHHPTPEDIRNNLC